MNRAEKRRQQKLAKKAASISPKHHSMASHQTLSLAMEHHNAGRLSEAESLYQQILQVDPIQPSALNLLGVIAHQAGKNDIAVDLITKAVAIKPEYAGAHNNLGNALKELGKFDEAVASYNKVLAIKPDYTEAHSNLGLALQELGKFDEAVASFNKALAINPDFVEAHSNLGLAQKELGKLDEAVASYNKALAIKPNFAEAHSNLGLTLHSMGKVSDAFSCHRRAIALNPHNNNFWNGLAQSLSDISFTSVDDHLCRDLLHLLELPAVVRPSNVVKPIISALHHNSSFSKILDQTVSRSLEQDSSFRDITEQLSTTPLFLQIIKLSPISDLKIEQMLTSLRHSMLQETMAGRSDENSLPFAAALALQCFTNEYIYPESEAETVEVTKLEQQAEALVENKLDVAPSIVAALGAYRPLHAYSWSKALQGREWGDDIKEVVERQISEPLEEQSRRSQIICLTPIKDTVSNSVREQYEENPYPRWVKTGFSDKGKSIRAILQGAPFQFDIGDYTSPEKPEILIAGCGTGQHAIDTASRFSNAHVLAVDLSLSSLSYSLRKTNELGLSNIEYAQADIMELGNLERQFDLIESVGVLHHLGDPLDGWRVLVNLLKPDGLMKIGLYSETARKCVVDGRSIIAGKGYTTSPEDIRRCRQEFVAMAEDGNEEITKVIGYSDFFSLSECRDLLFHVQEHRFTLPQIKEALKSLNLKFLGFEMQDQGMLKKFNASYPKKGYQTSLSLWDKFELTNPDTFIGMYQFWCQKM